jgi:hypothetical protein
MFYLFLCIKDDVLSYIYFDQPCWYKINCTVTVRDTDNCQNVDHGTGCTVYHSIYVTVKWNKTPSLIPTKDRALVTRLIKVNVTQYIVLDA